MNITYLLLLILIIIILFSDLPINYLKSFIDNNTEYDLFFIEEKSPIAKYKEKRQNISYDNNDNDEEEEKEEKKRGDREYDKLKELEENGIVMEKQYNEKKEGLGGGTLITKNTRLIKLFNFVDKNELDSWPKIPINYKSIKFENYKMSNGKVPDTVCYIKSDKQLKINNHDNNNNISNNIFVFVHGGAFIAGSPIKNKTLNFFNVITKYGLHNNFNIFLNLDYSLVPDVEAPQSIIDILNQLKLTMEKHEKIDNILFYGYSAGAFLISQCFVLLNYINSEIADPNKFLLDIDLNSDLINFYKNKKIYYSFIFNAGFYKLDNLYFNNYNISSAFKYFNKLYFKNKNIENHDPIFILNKYKNQIKFKYTKLCYLCDVEYYSLNSQLLYFYNILKILIDSKNVYKKVYTLEEDGVKNVKKISHWHSYLYYCYLNSTKDHLNSILELSKNIFY